MARKKKFKPAIVSDKDGIRFATPEPVAKYRAQRLKCNTIADISCGIGGQTIYFAAECESVYAIEIDPKKIAYARKNCEKLGIDNVEFICGDALSEEVIEQLPQLDIVFSDPARPPNEKKRDINSLRPPIPDVLAAYKTRSSNFAFEASPQITPERVTFDCEKEYLSLDGKLNRLNLYFGSIKKCDVSAVALPGNARIKSHGIEHELETAEEIASFAYEVEESVERANLLGQLANDIKDNTPDIRLFVVDSKRSFLTSDQLIDNPLLKNRYKVLLVSNIDYNAINKYLKMHDFGKVILRASVDPEEYWDIRVQLEAGLKGNKKAHLFLKDNMAILCELL
ncbi:methyltransferase domain-containing protein [Methanolobus sp. ZRKC3]|uniref:methyltransferase domain-containing protein n=1 Tax=Methanolobus sp. ZRKC3 TaxID=3125786 RepID=UPI003249AFA1